MGNCVFKMGFDEIGGVRERACVGVMMMVMMAMFVFGGFFGPRSA